MVNRTRSIMITSYGVIILSLYLAFVIGLKCSTDWRTFFFAGPQSESDIISGNYTVYERTTVTASSSSARRIMSQSNNTSH